MNASPTKTKRLSTSSPLTRKKPAFPPGQRSSRTGAKAPSGRLDSHSTPFYHQSDFAPTVALVLLDALLLVLAAYFLQEGIAQRSHPNVRYFVDFPVGLLPLLYVATGLLITNLALLFFTLLRRLRKRRWPWVTTGLVLIVFGLVIGQIGFDGVRAIIDPSSTPLDLTLPTYQNTK